MELNHAWQAARAVIEVLDRDGQVRQVHRIARWPLTVGRALDNDLPIADPYIAAHHLRIAPLVGDDGDGSGGNDGNDGEQAAASLRLHALDSLNGVQCGRRRLSSGQSLDLAAAAAAPLELQLGRTRLRLRLPGETLAPELPLQGSRSLARSLAPIAAAALALLLGLGFNVWLENDPDVFGKVLAGTLIGASVAAAAWCGLWAVLTKVFARQSRFGWHLKVLLFAAVLELAASAALSLLAFSLSWPWVSDFSFVVSFAIAAAMLYHHLLALEIARSRLLRVLAACGLLAAVGIALWSQQERNGRFGSELYMSHLFPPALRLAKAQPVGALVDSLGPLQAQLDAKAEKARNEDGDDDASESDPD
ncbi:MAG: hypothetical protein FWG56_04435 [Desulfovibrionaceae bacterium]|jgi:hypothetical protein|nr:hypothetical protein [Desulfovibrionaceae bacterium]